MWDLWLNDIQAKQSNIKYIKVVITCFIVTFKFFKIIFTGRRLQIKWLWEYFSIGLNISKSKLKFIKGVQCVQLYKLVLQSIKNVTHPKMFESMLSKPDKPFKEDNLFRHRLEDLLCRDAEYQPALGQLSHVTMTGTRWTETEKERKTWRTWKNVRRQF